MASFFTHALTGTTIAYLATGVFGRVRTGFVLAGVVVFPKMSIFSYEKMRFLGK